MFACILNVSAVCLGSEIPALIMLQICLLSVFNSCSSVECIYGAHCLCNSDVIAMSDYRNSMKLSYFEFGLCIWFGKNEKHSYA